MDDTHTPNGRYEANNRQWSKSHNNVSYATKRDATLGDVNVTITVGGLVICSVHIDPLIDANPIADKCRQMRRWYMTWRCDRFSTQWEQTETETQPTAKIPK
ncbi:Replicase polyprotein 1ab [Trichinella spiralis]|uniref:Replicase polyprotein 1ab n=1 Tax=Trichinella spiralis TaxID=6334 RepID=A0ABR3KUQ6_TRISP